HVARGGKPITLQLGAIDDMDMTFFNGHFLGGTETPGFWTRQRVYKVPGKWVKTGRNIITVRVIDHGWSGGMNGPEASMKWTMQGQKPVTLAGDWRYSPGVTLKSLSLGELTNPSPSNPSVIPTPVAPIHAMLRPLARPAKPVPAFPKGFKITGNQTIVILGGANAAESSRYGWMETLLAAGHPKHHLNVRNMAWPADTVYLQQRPRNFFSNAKPGYGEADHRPAITADTIFLWFGKMESLETGNGENPADFRAAYETILKQLANYTGRLVMVTPPPFEDPLKLGLDVKERNTNLAKYAEAIRQLAGEHGLPVVDLFTGLAGKPVTSDGQMLSAEGHRLAAQAMASQLGFSPQLSAGNEALREAIVTKNTIWRQYWLPTNWAFLYGNRQTQPSSRSHIGGHPRWFPEEVKSSLSGLEKMEKTIREKLP
ncbi:MAG: hypothetical protein GY917_13690, partial [Planctomycetaceae bacterium]|nr:hypothetical protein [Planctomycetaceae bacterium]